MPPPRLWCICVLSDPLPSFPFTQHHIPLSIMHSASSSCVLGFALNSFPQSRGCHCFLVYTRILSIPLPDTVMIRKVSLFSYSRNNSTRLFFYKYISCLCSKARRKMAVMSHKIKYRNEAVWTEQHRIQKRRQGFR